jgi:tetratricopeptide (TPR) repeat protein
LDARLIAGVLLCAALTSGCALVIPQTMELAGQWPQDLPEHVELSNVPFVAQDEYQCGPAALATTMSYAGIAISPDDLVSQVYLPARHGSLQIEMLAAPRKYGIVSYKLAPRFADVLREVAAGNPVIVLQDFGVWPISIWHYSVVVGYDHSRGVVLIRSGLEPRPPMPFAVLEYLWRESEYWAMVTPPATRLPASASESEYAEAAAATARVAGARAARIAYETLLHRWPDNLTGAIGLANSAYELGELGEAEMILRRASRLRPDSIPVLNNLAQVLYDEGRDKEALTVIERALGVESPFAAAVNATHDMIVKRISATPP